MDIVFEKTQVNVNISTKEVFTYDLKGFNHSKEPVKVKAIGASCGCLSFDNPQTLDPQSAFKIKLYLNKINKPGLFSVSLSVDFSNGQKFLFKVAGSAV